jgi:hypothetical protein
MKPQELALTAIRRAVALGLPVVARELPSEAILVRSRRGQGILYAFEVQDAIALAPIPYSSWHVVVARMDGGRVSLDPSAVPLALAQLEDVMSPVEADAWRLRISLVGRLRSVDRVPPVMEPYRALGAKIMWLAETMDYAAVLGEIVLAWYNEVTGRLDDAVEFQLAMGLLRGWEEGGLNSNNTSNLQ